MPKEDTKKHFFHFILIATVAFFTYANSLANNFVGDDYDNVVNNNLIKSYSNMRLLFNKNYIPKQNDFYYLPRSARIGTEINYRPVRLLTYFIDYTFWRLNPAGYHLSNIVYHILTGVSLYIFFLLIGTELSVSLLGALLFVVHPIQFEAVNSITFRGDMLYALFYILSLIFFIRSSHLQATAKKNLFYVLSLASFALSLFSKESAISLPSLLVIYDLHFNFNYRVKDTLKHFIQRYLGYFIILAFYTWAYLSMQRNNLSYPPLAFNNFTATSVNFVQSFYKYLVIIFKEISFYLQAMILPFDMHLLVMDKLPFSLSSPLFSFIGGLILFFVFCYALFKLYKAQKCLTFVAALFFITLLPLLSISILRAFLRLQSLKVSLVGYRFLYLPLSGFCLCLAILIKKSEDYIIKNKPHLINKKWLIGSSLLFVYISLTIPNNLFFKNDYVFSSELISRWPKSTISNQLFAAALEKNGDIDGALKHYEKMLRLGLNNSYIHYRMGYCNLLKERLNKAEEEFKESLRLFPDNFYSNYYLGELYLNKGDFALAIQYLKKAKELSMRDIPAIINLGAAYFKNQMYRDAEREWNIALGLEPNSELAKKNLAILDKAMQRKHP